METDAHGYPLATVHNGFYGKETSRWMNRAEDADKDRFNEVFDQLEQVTLRGKSLPDEATLAEEAKIKASAMKRHNSYSGQKGAPTGWTYTATRASGRKPPRAPLAAPQHIINQKSKDYRSDTPTDSSATSEVNTTGRKNRPLSAPAFKMPSDQRALHEATYRRELQKQMQEEATRKFQEESRRDRNQSPDPSTCVINVPGLMDRTTNSTYYALQERHPEEYEIARKAGQAHQVDECKISTLGVSMVNDDPELRSKMMMSDYTRGNDEVFPGGVLASDAEKKEGFYQWMQRQRIYYTDLLPDSNKPPMDEMIGESTLERKGEIIGALRQVHATVVPGQFKSHSQVEHCEMKPIENEESRAAAVDLARKRNSGTLQVYSPSKQELEQTRREIEENTRDMMGAKPTTMGLNWIGYSTIHQPAASTRKQRPSSAPSAHAHARAQEQRLSSCAAGAGGQNVYDRLYSSRSQTSRPASARHASAPRGSMHSGSNPGMPGLSVEGLRPTARPQSARPALAKKQKPVVKPETFGSKVPLKWAGQTGNVNSTYTDTFKIIRPEMRPAVKYVEFTAPAGAVNPHLAKIPFREAYPIPEGFVNQPSWPEGANGEAPMATTYRLTHAARAPEDVVRSMKAAAAATEDAHKALLQSTIPLGKGGVVLDDPKGWLSEMKDEYIPQESKWVVQDRARAGAQKAIWEGPTASTGRSTKPHPH